MSMPVIKKTVRGTFEENLARVPEALKAEGFGVLTEIDVKATLKKKIDVDFRKYVILGACSPPFAHRALQANLDIGVMLPCNVLVYEADDGSTVVSAMDPVAAMSGVDDPAIAEVAAEVEAKLQRVIEALD